MTIFIAAISQFARNKQQKHPFVGNGCVSSDRCISEDSRMETKKRHARGRFARLLFSAKLLEENKYCSMSVP